MHVYKSLEKRSYVLGLPLQEVGLLICLFMASVLGGSLLGILIDIPFWFYLISLTLVVGLYIVLKKAAKRKHPSFLLSWISYHFFQPQILVP